MFQRKKDLEKLEIHRDEWKKEAKQIFERKEESALDEQDQASHTVRQQQEDRRKK